MEGNVNRILLNQILLLVVFVFLVDQVLGKSRFARMVENDAHITQDAPPAEEFLVIPGGTKCLKIFRDSNRTWTEAVAKCRSHGLQLAEPRDAVAVRKYIVDKYGDGHTWVGARGEGVNMRWIGSQGVLPEDSSLWYPSSPGNEVSRDYCLRLLTDSEIMTDKPVQPYATLECSAMLTSTVCEEVPRLPLAHPEPTAEILSTTEPILITPEAERRDEIDDRCTFEGICALRIEDRWSREENACFNGNNNSLFNDVSFDVCKRECSNRNWCNSVEYNFRQSKCYISEDTRSSPLFESPCKVDGWTFIEKIL